MTDTWKKLLEEEKEKEYFKKLEEFLDKEYEENKIYPERKKQCFAGRENSGHA